MKAAVIMSLYALVMVGGGLTAYLLAPEGSNAITALIVPSVAALLMLLCAGCAALLSRSRIVGMVGIHLGLVLPLVFALGIGQRAMVAGGASAEYRESRAEFDRMVEAGEMTPGDESFRLYLQREKYEAAYANDAASPAFADWSLSEEGQDLNDHDKAYLAMILWTLTGASIVAFVALLLNRPKPAARGGAAESDTLSESRPESRPESKPGA